MATYHILNGDCLADQLKLTDINQDFIVCKECFIEGNLSGDASEFWKVRAKFIAETYNVSVEDYFNNTVKEFEKLKSLPPHSEVCLWFENDLFCQANMWFVISLLAEQHTFKLYRVFPAVKNEADTWKGFGMASSEMLEQAYSSKVLFQANDIELGNNLWTAYKSGDFIKLKELSQKQSDCFQYLEEVCQAQIDRFPADQSLGRPDKAVKEIMETKSKEFYDVFVEFSNREGIYGFGDLQLKSIYERQMHSY